MATKSTTTTAAPENQDQAEKDKAMEGTAADPNPPKTSQEDQEVFQLAQDDPVLAQAVAEGQGTVEEAEANKENDR